MARRISAIDFATRRWAGTVASTAMAMLVLGSAQAATCQLSVPTFTVSASAYEPFGAALTNVPIDLTVTNPSAIPCAFGFTIQGTPGSPRILKSGSFQLQYQIVDASSAQIPNEGGVTVATPYTVGAHASVTLHLQAVFASGQVTPPSSYTDLIGPWVVNAVGDFFLGPKTSMNVTVPARAEVDVAGTVAGFGSVPQLSSLELGTLQSGSSGQAYLQVRSNENVQVSITSQNSGVLQLQGSPASPTIAYNLSVDGASVDILHGTQTLDKTPGLTLDGQSYPLAVTVPIVGAVFSGRYTDVLEISVTPF